MESKNKSETFINETGLIHSMTELEAMAEATEIREDIKEEVRREVEKQSRYDEILNGD